ncbi:oxidoreductase [Streptomyces sp. NPDC058308]|uniref:oxidoreductase n=1 Tax=Streptomyces sp. NPDC058308 TaxID=3346440 RepID=UPI0036E548A7
MNPPTLALRPRRIVQQLLHIRQAGPALAADLERIASTNLLRRTTATAVAVSADYAHAFVRLADGTEHTAVAAIIATGVTTLSPADTPWITAPDGFWPDPLWRTGPDQMSGVTWVLGADRPLGTWLRAHPTVARTISVLCPPEDDYKATEIAEDPRVNLVRCSAVTITPAPTSGWILDVDHRGGEQRQYIAGTVLGNLVNRPAALDDLAQATDGYCPPDEQHPRIWTAGDLRSARFQRIVTAHGLRRRGRARPLLRHGAHRRLTPWGRRSAIRRLPACRIEGPARSRSRFQTMSAPS